MALQSLVPARSPGALGEVSITGEVDHSGQHDKRRDEETDDRQGGMPGSQYLRAPGAVTASIHNIDALPNLDIAAEGGWL